MDRTRCGRRVVAAALAFLTVGVALSAHPAAAAQSSVAAVLLGLINHDRAAAGLAPLAWNPQLAAVGEGAPYSGCGFAVHGRTEDMIERGYFAHPILGCGGRNVFDMLRAAGVPFAVAGENIGWEAGLTDPAAQAAWLDQQFMASPEHRANILDPRFTSVGVGAWATAPGQSWTGAGAALTGVLMVSEEFAATPGGGHVAPRVSSTGRAAPPAGAPRSSPPTAAAPIAVPAPRPALPDTGVTGTT